MTDTTPWQIRMFQKTLKKKLRLKHLKEHIGNIERDKKCLLVTCGDNNGAMNYYLREIGGAWSWADLEDKSISEMEELLQDKVHKVENEKLPFPDEVFDHIVSIDVHEHLQDTIPFTEELWRVAKKGGQVVITVPNGDETKMATRFKNAVGMTKEKYGHVREGLDIPELKEIMKSSNIIPDRESSFSKLFTEMLELGINFLYVMVLAGKSKAKVEEGTIAPSTKDQLKSVEKTYRMYALIYPFFWLVSRLDALFFFTRGYAVMVSGKKEGA
jgi:ubiquinone/menaquinone biosynthesis C-methylase UbiE